MAEFDALAFLNEPEESQEFDAKQFLDAEFDAAEFLNEPHEPSPLESTGLLARTAEGIGDTPELLNIGFQNLGLAGREIATYILPEAVVNTIDSVDSWLYGKTSTDLMEGNIKASMADISEATKEAMAKEWVSETEEGYGLGPAAADPRSYYAGVMMSLPEMAATMGPAAAIGKTVYASAMARGATKVAAASKAAIAAQVAGSVAEGSLGGAHASMAVREAITGMEDEVLLKSEVIQALMDDGLSLEQAKAQLAEDKATQAFLTAGVATGMFGGMGDRLLAKGITSGIKGGILKRMGAGAVAEGLLEELPQSALSKMAENIALQAADPTISALEGVGEEAVGGLAIGSVMGAGFGAMTRAETSEDIIKDVTGAPTVDDAIQMANEVADAPVEPTLDEELKAELRASYQADQEAAARAEEEIIYEEPVPEEVTAAAEELISEAPIEAAITPEEEAARAEAVAAEEIAPEVLPEAVITEEPIVPESPIAEELAVPEGEIAAAEIPAEAIAEEVAAEIPEIEITPELLAKHTVKVKVGKETATMPASEAISEIDNQISQNEQLLRCLAS
jgi:hypothetical protein